MTGLIRKDMYCLRKILKTFFLVTTGVIVLSVLLIISAQCGNIANGIQSMEAESGMGEEAFYSLFRLPIWLTLFIPMAFLSMIVECFKEDRKAGFAKTMLCLPLTDVKIVGSRYLSCMVFALLGLAGSSVAAIFVSLASETFQLQELMGYVFCFSGVLLIYMSFVMFMIYYFGVERADFIQCAPFLVLLVAIIVVVQRMLSGVDETEVDALSINLVNSASKFMTEKFWLIYLVALACMALSFWGSCMVMKKRKGGI